MPTAGPRSARMRRGDSVARSDAVERDAAAGLPQARRQQPKHRARGHRLAAAGFADNGQKLAALDRDGDAVDHRRAAALGFDAQIVDRKQR